MIDVNSRTKKTKGRVLVAMSGGVDSSVAAAILVEQGYDVVGCTMQVWDYTKNESCSTEEGNGTCCSSTDVDDARAVADHLDIPFYVINCEEKFQSFVIDDFIESYLEGRTPIPCVHCNTHLKFDHLLKKMHELDCDYLATGHYAQVQKTMSGGTAIVTSEDGWKDQTYFLFTLKPEILNYLKLPVGDWEKPQLRAYAEKIGLPVAAKKDSTGICFIGKQDYSDFIDQHADRKRFIPGKIQRYPDGEILGEHKGIHKFTYGQRKGLGVASNVPLYVVKVEPTTGVVWLGEEKDLYSRSLSIQKPNWLDEFSEDEVLNVKIRFAHKGAPAKIIKEGDQYKINFTEPQRAVTPGQAAVVYRNKQLLGGGWIV